MSKRPTNEQKEKVKKRAGGVCEYCRSQAAYSSQSFSVEHILPFSKGGKTALENLAFACQGCNNHKYTATDALDSVTRKIVPLFHPRQQNWDEHFAWNNDFTLIIGITPTGRATVELLRLNREGCVNLRRALYALGKHPPKI
jgi:5-methylcytosine-specific restriction endonuclease McrA